MRNKLRKLVRRYTVLYWFVDFYRVTLIGFCDKFFFFLRKWGYKDYRFAELKKMENRYIGKRCFIVATGPSLTFEDLSLLKDEYCFSMNSIIKVFDKTEWRPTFYGIQDEKVFQKMKENIFAEDLENIFIPNYFHKEMRQKKNVIPYPLVLLDHQHARSNREEKFAFSDNAYAGVYDGFTITYSLIQLAVYLGFKKIYLLGCDTNYSTDESKQYFVSSGYFNPYANNAPLAMIRAYKEARKYAENHNVDIINCTQGGMLEVFVRQKLTDILS